MGYILTLGMVILGVFAIAILSSALDVGDQVEQCTDGDIIRVSSNVWACANISNGYTCPNDEYLYQIYVNGSYACRADTVGGSGGTNYWLDQGDYLEINTTWADNLVINGYINASDWSNVSLNSDQVLDMNDTINHLVSQASVSVNDNSTFGIIRGVTTGSTDGSIANGYVGANALCDTDHTGSHMCLEVEVLKAIANGNVSLTGQYWISKGAPGFTANANDCEGWTATTGEIGPFWDWDENADAGAGKLTPCSSSLQILCCGDSR